MSEFYTDKLKEDKKREFIRNLWLLLLYAPDFFSYIAENLPSSATDNPDSLADLIAKILVETMKLRLRRNLNFSYQPRQEILRRARGRIDIFKTERRQLLQKAQVACKFEELTVDTPRNRFARDALCYIARFVKNADIASECYSIALKLERSGVIGIAPTFKQMKNEKYGRNDRNDKNMVYASRLAFGLSLPVPLDENDSIDDLIKPAYKGRLHDLYEKAITNFYKAVFGNNDWTIDAQTPMRWWNWKVVGSERSEREKIFPGMIPDIVMYNPTDGRNIIVDTKFTNVLDEKKKLISSHIYQMLAYLQSQKINGAEGVLLYPYLYEADNLGDKGNFLRDFRIQREESNFNLRFAVVDLFDNEKAIRERLKYIINEKPNPRDN